MSIENFISNFKGGTRKNRFRVKCTPPSSPDLSTDGWFTDFHITAASMPASILTTNPIDYQGRKILYPGDRIYGGNGYNLWEITVLDDIGHGGTQTKNLWHNLHKWNDHINNHVNNTGTTSAVGTVIVEQFSLNEDADAGEDGVIKRATLYGAWPQSVGGIDFDMQARDQYNFFTVAFCFRYIKYEDFDGN